MIISANSLKNILLRKTLVLIILCLSVVNVYASSAPLQAYKQAWPILLQAQLSVFEDRTGSYSAKELWDHPELFKAHGDKIVNFGSSDSVFWLRCTVHNSLGQDQRLFLVFPSSMLDDIRMELRHQDGSLDSFRAGDRPINQIVPRAASPVFPVIFKAGETAELLIRVCSTNLLTLPMQVMDAERYEDFEHKRDLWNGALIGIFSSLFCYNLLLFALLRQTAYGWYVAFLPITWLLLSILYGFFGSDLFPASAWWRNEGFIFLAGLAYFTNQGFGRAVLDLPSLPRLNRLAMTLMAFSLIESLLVFVLPLRLNFQLISITGFIFPMSAFFIGFLAWRRGKTAARFFIAGQIASWIGQVLFMFWANGILPYSWLIRNGISIGISIDALLLSMALADRIRILQNAKAFAEKKMRDALESRREELEYLVYQRTRELEIARQEAEHSARTDALTGLPNRRAVMDEGKREFARARREDAPLSLIILDIDHFKQINDREGHVEGDRVLVKVARSINEIKRAGDLFGRIGGEEFLAFLPETPLSGAKQLAERYRSHIAANIRTGQSEYPVTISLGVTELSEEDGSLERLIDRADRALYRAKEQGRNRVVAALDGVPLQEEMME